LAADRELGLALGACAGAGASQRRTTDGICGPAKELPARDPVGRKGNTSIRYQRTNVSGVTTGPIPASARRLIVLALIASRRR
jgi:hypothetical protein